MVREKTIYFYSWAKKYFEFSNFSLHSIVINGKEYATNEHYFQSIKFVEPEYQEQVRLAKTPKEAKILGSSRKHKIHHDWDSRRLDVMREAVLAKFTQHENLKQLLLSTGNATLVEDSPTDSFWGIGRNKTGQNMLGKILMEVRELLRNQVN
ncbi:NADAR family protein [Bacillus cereus]